MPQIRIVRTDDLSAAELDDVRALLVAGFDGNFSDDDWQHALGGWHVIATDGAPLAHAALVARTLEVGGRRLRAGYVEGVTTLAPWRHQGLGTAVMRPVGTLLAAEFELGALSTGSHAFYGRLGWERWQGPTYVRRGDDLVRTAEEDDGIMVLRYRGTARLGLDQPITCEDRPGDPW
ncbi:MAG TPA: GNAT family N-acetyltransferase [Acidimicrobiales bacterium]|nr:GNAT family N-acetyltransferase [Acidimicrobiales bacterium]